MPNQSDSSSITNAGASAPPNQPVRLDDSAGAPAVETAAQSTPQLEAAVKGASEEVPKDLLHAFEKNYHSYTKAWKWLIATVIVAAVTMGLSGMLLLTARSPQQTSTAKKQAEPASASVPGNQTRSSALPINPQQAVQQKISAKTDKPATASARSLPSFIPADGLDSSFATRKPGWERYAEKGREFRLFRSGDRIKVLQVLAGKGQAITASFMKTVLNEMSGSGDFTVRSSEQKQGFLLQRCSVGDKGTLLIYSNKNSGAIRAFVISFEQVLK